MQSRKEFHKEVYQNQHLLVKFIKENIGSLIFGGIIFILMVITTIITN